MEPNNVNELKPYSTKELAGIYGISCKTFRRWVSPFKAEVGQRQGRYFNVSQVKTIFLKLGLPAILDRHPPQFD